MLSSQYHDCRTGCIAESKNDCGACVSKHRILVANKFGSVSNTQQERCQDICLFRSCELPGFVPGNDCGAQCDVSFAFVVL